MNRFKRQILFCWWAALMVTTVASLLPNMGPPPTPLLGIGLDKFIHSGTYLILAVVPVLFFTGGGVIIRSVVLVAVMSIGIELAQNLAPGRSFSIGDIMANMLGVFLGVVAGLSCRRQLVSLRREGQF